MVAVTLYAWRKDTDELSPTAVVGPTDRVVAMLTLCTSVWIFLKALAIFLGTILVAVRQASCYWGAWALVLLGRPKGTVCRRPSDTPTTAGWPCSPQAVGMARIWIDFMITLAAVVALLYLPDDTGAARDGKKADVFLPIERQAFCVMYALFVLLIELLAYVKAATMGLC